MRGHARFEDHRRTSHNGDLISIKGVGSSPESSFFTTDRTAMEDTRHPASAVPMEQDNVDVDNNNDDDAALNIRLESVFGALMNILNVAAPSNADIGDTHRMNMAATDSNRKHLHGGKKAAAAAAAAAATAAPSSIPVGKIDEAEAQKVSNDLEALKTHRQEVSSVFNVLMQYVEGDGPYRYPSTDTTTTSSTEIKKEKGEEEEDEAAASSADASSASAADASSVLTAVCANNRILHPLRKLQMFAWLIKSKGVQVDNLAQILNSRRGSNALWMMLPALINVSMDIIVKLCCTWSVYASLIDLEALSSKEAGDNNNCLLASTHPSVKYTVAYVNNLIKSRRDTMVHAPSAASAYASNETYRSFKNRRGIMLTQLADIISPLLNNIDEVLRNHLME